MEYEKALAVKYLNMCEFLKFQGRSFSLFPKFTESFFCSRVPTGKDGEIPDGWKASRGAKEKQETKPVLCEEE